MITQIGEHFRTGDCSRNIQYIVSGDFQLVLDSLEKLLQIIKYDDSINMKEYIYQHTVCVVCKHFKLPLLSARIGHAHFVLADWPGCNDCDWTDCNDCGHYAPQLSIRNSFQTAFLHTLH